MKSIDSIEPSSSTKCFYFDIDDVKYSDVRRNDFAPPGVRRRLMVNLNMASKTKCQRVRTKIDSGSDGNLLALSVYLSLFPGATRRSLLQSVDPNVSLYAYNGTEIQQLGHCKLRVSFKNRSTLCDFYITDHQTTLFGLPDMENLKITTVHADPEDSMPPSTYYHDKAKYDGTIDQCKTELHDMTDKEPEQFDRKKRKMDDYFLDGPTKQDDMLKSIQMTEHVKKKFPRVFSGGVGCFKGTVHIDIQKDAQPYQALQRRVPIALQKPFKAELDQMVKNGIIEPLKVDEHREWCNSFVVVRKPSGDVQLCIDPAKLNRAIFQPIHRGQTVLDILSKLSGVKYFSLLDAKHGF